MEVEGKRTQENEVFSVKVITDEQMEVLRKQISAYGTICEQLVEMHKSFMAQQDTIAGIGSLYSDPLGAVGSSHKFTARQRWTPTSMQLQILESIFEHGNGTPNKQKIKDIAVELSQHGQITETNVYNWFQNRRARSKRKQVGLVPNGAESEADIDMGSPDNKRVKLEKSCNGRSNDYPIINTSRSFEMHHFEPEIQQARGIMYSSNDSSRSSGGSAQLLFYNNI